MAAKQAELAHLGSVEVLLIGIMLVLFVVLPAVLVVLLVRRRRR